MVRYLVFVWLATIGCGFAVPGAHAAPAGGVTVETDGDSVQHRGNPLWGTPLNLLAATRDRPIFSPSRRPSLPIPAAPVALTPAAPTPISTEPEQLPLKLLGTITGGENGIAICLNPSNNDVLRVRTGESFEGWTLRSVRGREVAFEKASRHVVLALPSPDDSQPPAGTSPPAPIIAVTQAPAPGPGSWMDGDGQMIAPPPRSP